MARYASKRLNGVVVADAQRLPFGDQTFDVVFARAVLHHLPDPKLGAAEIARVLRAGGRCVFLDTHKNVLSRISRELMRGGGHFSEGHKNFSDSEYLEFLRPYFTLSSTEYVGYAAYTLLGFPDILSLYKYFPGKRLWTPLLIWIDEVWERIPLARWLGLCLLVSAKKIDPASRSSDR